MIFPSANGTWDASNEIWYKNLRNIRVALPTCWLHLISLKAPLQLQVFSLKWKSHSYNFFSATVIYFSGPHRPSSLRNSSVRPLVAFELWFLSDKQLCNTRCWISDFVFYLNGIDVWLRNARELLMWRPTDLNNKYLRILLRICNAIYYIAVNVLI